MKTQKGLYFRLLKLFPVKIVKEHFNLKADKHEQLLVEVLDKYSADSIKQFCYQNFHFTKQHIYLFTHEVKKFLELPDNLLQSNTLYKRITENNESSYFYFLDINYNILILSKEVKREIIPFIVPMRIRLRENILYVEFTIVEKNVSSYINNSSNVINLGKDMDEKVLIESITNQISTLSQVEICDLNKGIKYLWNENMIDSPYVKYKKSKSTSTEAMDEEYTVKEQYPDLFKLIMDAPLRKTIFKVKKDKIAAGVKFAVEPTDGKIIFATYAQTLEEKEYVIRKILEHN